MRLKEEGNLLTVEYRETLLFTLLAIFAGAGVFLLYTDGPSLGLIVFAIPLIVVPFVSVTKVTADMSTQVLTIGTKSLVKKSEKNIPFRDIAGIEMREFSHRISGRGAHSYPLYVIMRDGTFEKMIEESGKGRNIVDTSKDEREVGRKLAERIGVPFTEKKNPSARELFDMAQSYIQKANKQSNDTTHKTHS